VQLGYIYHSACLLQQAVLLHKDESFGLCRWHVLAGVDRVAATVVGVAMSPAVQRAVAVFISGGQLAEAGLLAGCMQSITVDASMHHPSNGFSSCR
jgi:hypothetical protein